MKKLALLYAVMTLGMSSWAFAADNPPPPPEKGAQHQGKPPVKNGQHEGKQAQYNSKQPQRDGKQPQHDGKQPQHNGKQPPKRERAQRETAAAESVTLWPGFRVRPFFILRQPSLTNSCRSLRCPKKACIAPDIVCPRHCSVEKRYVKEKHKRPAVAVRIIFRASVGPSSGTRILSGAKSRTAAAARSG